MHSHIALVVVLLSSLLLSACGGGSSSGRSGAAVVTPPPAEPPPSDPPPYEPPVSGDYEMPPLELVLAPEADFEPACASTPPPGDAVPAPPVSGDTTGANSGVLVDSAVSGVAYQTASIEGVTDAKGSFHFQADESVHFALGDTNLGEISGMTQVTPFDLAGSSVPVGMDAITPALENENHPFHTVINTAVLLQSLDEDGEPDNGIAIPPEVAALFDGTSLNTRQSMERFQNEYKLAQILTAANDQMLFSVPHGTVNPARALAHLYSTLGIEAHTFGISLEESDWDGDGNPNDMARYRYDADGNLVEVVSSYDGGWQANVESWAYDERGKLTSSETREVGEQSAETWVYLESGEVSKHELDGDDNGIVDETQIWSYKYNPDGSMREASMINRVDYEDEPLSAVVTFEYNSAGDPSRIEFSGDSLHLAAAQLGLPTIGYLEYGTTYVISYEYDASGKLVADTLDGQNPELGYHIVTRRLDSRGNVTWSEGRFMQGSDNDEQVTISRYQYEYDAQGNIIEQRDDGDGDGEFDQIAFYSYDQHDAIVRTEWDNDADGSIDNIDLRPYEYEYDSSDRIIRRSLELNGETVEVIGYSWHPNDTLAQEDHWSRDIAVTNISTWQYDALGRLLREQQDDGGDGLADRVTMYGYDACGGLVSREVFSDTDEEYRPSRESWAYDAAGRLRYHEWVGANAVPDIPGSPFPPGFPVFASDGFERSEYGAEGRLVRYQFVCHGDCFALVGGWDLDLVPLPDQIINREYDEAGRITRELVDENGDGQAERVTVYAYHANGKVIRELVDTSASGTPNEATFYHYDDNGRLLRRDVDNDGNETIDAVDATEYDAYGNVLSRYSDENNDGVAEESTSFTHYYDDEGNHIRQEDDRNDDGVINRVQEWTYDASGNVLSHGYDDDVDGILEQVESFEYDTHGNLLRQSTGYSFDGDGVMEETETWEYTPTGWGHLLNDVQE